MQDIFDPFLGDKHFEEELIKLINSGIISKVFDGVFDEYSKNTRIADIRRGIRIYMARADKESIQQMKNDYIKFKTNEEKSIWLFISMGRCFYD